MSGKAQQAWSDDQKASPVTHVERSDDIASAKADAADLAPDVDATGMAADADIGALEERQMKERRLVRKIDMRLLPILVIIYILNYLDRNNASAARLKGLEADLHLVEAKNQYETGLSILYVGYILMQIPSNLFLAKTGKPSLYLPACVVVWGTISALTAITKNFRDLVLVRFFLGFAEAAFFPGALFLMSKWYTKKELATRNAFLYSGSIISNAFGGLIASGILGTMEGKRGIRAWRWLFIIEGSISVAVALIAIFILPDFPETSKFLTPEERELAQRRLAEDVGEIDTPENGQQGGGGVWEGFCLAMADPKTWVLAFMLTASVTGLAFNAFFPTIVGTLGYKSTTITLLLTVPPWFWAWLVVLFNAIHADKTGERMVHVVWPHALGIVGFIIGSATQNTGARYLSMFIMASSYAGFVVILTWISNSMPRPPYKRAVAIAFVNAFSQLGNVAGSYVWPTMWGPTYVYSQAISISCFGVAIILAIAYRFYLQRLNKRLDEGEDANALEKRKGFRYLV